MRTATPPHFLLTACCIGLSGLLVPGTAQAGFDWTPAPAPVEVPASAAVPPAPVSSSIIPELPAETPIVVETPAPVKAPAPVVPVAPVVAIVPTPPPAPISTPSAPPAPPALEEPVAAPVYAPLNVANPPSAKAAVAQDPKKTVYPPPGNAPAAPLSGTRTVESPFRTTQPMQPDAPIAEKSVGSAPAPVPTPAAVETVESKPALPVQDGQGMTPVPTTVADRMEAEASTLLVVPPADDSALPPRQVTAEEQGALIPAPAPASVSGFAVLDGFGNNIPMDLALKQVIPADYKVIDPIQVGPDQVVSWTGGRPWNEVLSDMLAGHGIAAVIGDKTVTLHRIGKSSSTVDQKAPETVADIAPEAGLPSVVRAEPPAQTVLKSVSYQPGQTGMFQAAAGDDLKTVLSAWSRQANVTLNWSASANYTVPKAVDMKGTYAQAVAGLLDQFKAADLRPVGRLHPNAPQGPAVLVIKTPTEKPAAPM